MAEPIVLEETSPEPLVEELADDTGLKENDVKQEEADADLTELMTDEPTIDGPTVDELIEKPFSCFKTYDFRLKSLALLNGAIELDAPCIVMPGELGMIFGDADFFTDVGREDPSDDLRKGVKCRRYAHIYDAKVHVETEFHATFVGPQGPFCGICAAQYVSGDFICILARYTMPCVPRRTSQIGVCHAECMNGYVFVDSEDDPEEDLMDSDRSGQEQEQDFESSDEECSSDGLDKNSLENWNSSATSPSEGGAGGDHQLSFMD